MRHTVHTIPIYTEHNWRLVRAMYPIGRYSKIGNRYMVYINLNNDSDKAVIQHLYRHSPWLASMICTIVVDHVIFHYKVKARV